VNSRVVFTLQLAQIMQRLYRPNAGPNY
jgi:hypothetical protein